MLRFNFAEEKKSILAKYFHPDIVFTIFLLLSVLSIEQYWERSINTELVKTKDEIRKLELEKSKLKNIEKKEKELAEYRKELQKKLTVVKELERKRHVPSFLYFFGNKKYISGIWLSSLSYQDNSINLTGNSKNLKNLYTFLKELDKNLGTVTFKNASLETIEFKNLHKQVNYYKFQVNLELRNGISH
ncbi:PilN domain-containing protein [Desulfurobacterium thermolithotrophum]|uniref:PilN domain-containing protein n=1 Tax=Desulfurobacterium thermolithotrophum TaxID=64160 RepID=UPI0013D879C7|nr:PilN domain-containing protein [Desulfurobacterium thermolithotrophum]